MKKTWPSWVILAALLILLAPTVSAQITHRARIIDRFTFLPTHIPVQGVLVGISGPTPVNDVLVLEPGPAESPDWFTVVEGDTVVYATGLRLAFRPFLPHLASRRYQSPALINLGLNFPARIEPLVLQLPRPVPKRTITMTVPLTSANQLRISAAIPPVFVIGPAGGQGTLTCVSGPHQRLQLFPRQSVTIKIIGEPPRLWDIRVTISFQTTDPKESGQDDAWKAVFDLKDVALWAQDEASPGADMPHSQIIPDPLTAQTFAVFDGGGWITGLPRGNLDLEANLSRRMDDPDPAGDRYRFYIHPMSNYSVAYGDFAETGLPGGDLELDDLRIPADRLDQGLPFTVVRTVEEDYQRWRVRMDFSPGREVGY